MTLRLVRSLPQTVPSAISYLDDTELAAIAGTGLDQALRFGGAAHFEYGPYAIDVRRTDVHPTEQATNASKSLFARLDCVVRQNGVVVVHRVWQVAEHQLGLEQFHD
jgi:hypothetical protein